LYDGDPRKHLTRAKDLLAGEAEASVRYPRLRYIALDLRLAIETTLQEELTASYSEFSSDFAGLWRAPDFAAEIRRQAPGFDLRSRLTPIVLRVGKRKRITDYRPIDLKELSKLHGQLSDHLHHLNRYDGKKGATDRAGNLRDVIDRTSSELTALLKYPRMGLQFHSSDQQFFEDVLAEKRPIEDFERHVAMGRLKNFTLKTPAHHPDPSG
jgi:hypothetical protein